MNPLTQKVLESFSQNMLDGDRVDDCGNAMLSAKYVAEFLTEIAVPLIREETVNDCVAEVKKHWTFGDDQRHTHSWHDRADCLEKLQALTNTST